MKAILGALSALFIAASATAAPIAIDDFNTSQRVTDNLADGVSASGSTSYILDGNALTRTITVDQTEHSSVDPRLASTAKAGFGTLKLSNDSQTNSLIDVTYGIDSLLDDVSDSANLTLQVLFADGGRGQPFSVAGYLNGTLLASRDFPSPGSFSFTLPGLADSGNQLRLLFSGGTGFDADLGPISVEASEVPEPAALGLLGLGVFAIGFGRRRLRRA
jgi:hypothetical protein